MTTRLPLGSMTASRRSAEKRAAFLHATSRQETLNAYLRVTDAWRMVLNDAGAAAYYPVMLPFNSPVYYPKGGYSAKDFDAIVPGLSVVMNVLRQLEGPGESIGGTVVRASIELLRGEIKCYSGDMFGLPAQQFYTKPSSFIVDISRPAKQPGLILKATFTSYTVVHVDPTLAYVQTYKTPQFTLDQDWLDLHRPGWRDTLLLAETFALPKAELAQLLLFQDQPALVPEPVSLATVGFEL